MPAFDGNTLMFGNQLAAECFTAMAPLRRQRVAFPGLNGLLDKPLGSQGGRTLIRGVLEAPDLATLATLESFWYGYQSDGGAYTLITTVATWPWVVLAQYRPIGEVYIDGMGLLCRDYEADFDHLP